MTDNSKDGPYTLSMSIRVHGYGTDKQAGAHAQRIRQMLATAMHRFVNLVDVEVHR